MAKKGLFRILATAVVLLLIVNLFIILKGAERVGPVAVSKGSQAADEVLVGETAVDQAAAREAALADEGVAALLAGKDFGFLAALPLSSREAAARQDAGCGAGSCARVSFYNYTDGGTVEAIVNMASGVVVDSLVNRAARPGASPQVLPRALGIAAADRRVTDVVGDVRQAEPVMGPMSAWLLDDECLRDWCVDLTYAAPDGSGRTFHVFVNMERQEVSRLFYSRSRPERTVDRPAAQDRIWENGCHEAYSWNVCWEMTANDGVEFYDATYNGDSIFSSVKMGQIEVFYPSWPGGYRDEIGYLASVAPADGTLDLDFVSHGPGCDDPMIYRAFWRIDLELAGETSDELLVWEDTRWVEAEREMRLEVFENLSPTGEVLITGGGDYLYSWQPQRSDPSGLDEALIFLLRWNEDEGEGEIVAGPPDTFWPPGQWLTEEPLANEDIVVWYVSILKGRKGGPWWCAPEPAPDFSPCAAEIRIVPIDEVVVEPTAEVSPTVEGEGTAVPTVTETAEAVTPTTVPTTGPTSTPQVIAGNTVEEVLQIAGCDNCHLIGELGEAGKVGPDLSSIGLLAGERVPGQPAAEYLRTSIVDPEAFLAPDCPNGPCLPGIMPEDYSSRLTERQIETMVNFMLEQRAGAEPAGEQAPSEGGMSAGVTAVLIIGGLVLVGVIAFGVARRRGERSEG